MACQIHVYKAFPSRNGISNIGPYSVSYSLDISEQKILKDKGNCHKASLEDFAPLTILDQDPQNIITVSLYIQRSRAGNKLRIFSHKMTDENMKI